MLNSVILLGNLVRDPETRYNNDMAVTSFTIAVQRQGKEDKADFIRIVVFGKQAENCEKYLKKGSKVAIQGRLQVSQYESNGEKKWSTDVVASNVQFLTPKGKEDTYEGFRELTEEDEDNVPF